MKEGLVRSISRLCLIHCVTMQTPAWQPVKEYEDIQYFKADGIAKIVINRPHKRNAFRPKTVFELYEAFANAREDNRIGVVLLTGAVLMLMANMHFVLVEINRFGEKGVISMKLGHPG